MSSLPFDFTAGLLPAAARLQVAAITDFRKLVSLLTSKKSTVAGARKWVITHGDSMQDAVGTLCSAIAANGTKEELAFHSQLGILYVINDVVTYQKVLKKPAGLKWGTLFDCGPCSIRRPAPAHPGRGSATSATATTSSGPSAAT